VFIASPPWLIGVPLGVVLSIGIRWANGFPIW